MVTRGGHGALRTVEGEPTPRKGGRDSTYQGRSLTDNGADGDTAARAMKPREENSGLDRRMTLDKHRSRCAVGCHSGAVMRIVLLLLLLSALPEPLRSEALPQWKAALLFGEPDASSQEIRQEIARELRTKVKALLAFLPNLKPSQVLWLAAEREAAKKLDKVGSGEAIVSKTKQIMASPDFKLGTLRNALSTLEASMNCVLQANVRVRRELQCWAHRF
jgi:hypothetical protein